MRRANVGDHAGEAQSVDPRRDGLGTALTKAREPGNGQSHERRGHHVAATQPAQETARVVEPRRRVRENRRLRFARGAGPPKGAGNPAGDRRVAVRKDSKA